jgi:hypothetical protein
LLAAVVHSATMRLECAMVAGVAGAGASAVAFLFPVIKTSRKPWTRHLEVRLTDFIDESAAWIEGLSTAAQVDHP